MCVRVMSFQSSNQKYGVYLDEKVSNSTRIDNIGLLFMYIYSMVAIKKNN